MNNGDVFKMLERLQEGEDVLFGDQTQISLISSRPFFFHHHTYIPLLHWDHNISNQAMFIIYFDLCHLHLSKGLTYPTKALCAI